MKNALPTNENAHCKSLEPVTRCRITWRSRNQRPKKDERAIQDRNPQPTTQGWSDLHKLVLGTIFFELVEMQEANGSFARFG